MYKRENDCYKIPSFVAFINTIIIILNHTLFLLGWAHTLGPIFLSGPLSLYLSSLSPPPPLSDTSLFNSAYSIRKPLRFHIPPPKGKQNKIRSPITHTEAELALIRPSLSRITDRGGVGDGRKRSSRVHKSY